MWYERNKFILAGVYDTLAIHLLAYHFNGLEILRIHFQNLTPTVIAQTQMLYLAFLNNMLYQHC